MAIQHYIGFYGIFDYDDEEFYADAWYLRYIGKETDGSKIKIPDGITSCGHMFYNNRTLKTPPVIPDGVKDCRDMFNGCRSLEAAPEIPKSVSICTNMFIECESIKTAPVIPDSVEKCDGMFADCNVNVQKAGLWNIKHRGQSYYEYKEKYNITSYDATPDDEPIIFDESPDSDKTLVFGKVRFGSYKTYDDMICGYVVMPYADDTGAGKLIVNEYGNVFTARDGVKYDNTLGIKLVDEKKDALDRAIYNRTKLNFYILSCAAVEIGNREREAAGSSRYLPPTQPHNDLLVDMISDDIQVD